jgi:hypothetical protein
VQRPPHAEVGEATGTTTAEHEFGRRARDEPGDPVEVGDRVGADVGDAVEPELVGEH